MKMRFRFLPFQWQNSFAVRKGKNEEIYSTVLNG